MIEQGTKSISETSLIRILNILIHWVIFVGLTLVILSSFPFVTLSIHGLVNHHPLVHMGAGVCEVNPALFFPLQIPHTCHKHLKYSPVLNLNSSYHMSAAHMWNTICCLKSDVMSLRWFFGSGRVFLNLFTSELQRCRRRKMLQGWVALWGCRLYRNVWQRLCTEPSI